MTSNVDAWLKSGEYLPPPLRDFHDQKEVFKAIHERIAEDQSSLVKRPTWIEGHVYVIDTFLWFMARRGYTLQKTRKRLEFRDLEEDVRAQTQARNEASEKAIMTEIARFK
jgi:hypothetical protein